MQGALSRCSTSVCTGLPLGHDGASGGIFSFLGRFFLGGGAAAEAAAKEKDSKFLYFGLPYNKEQEAVVVRAAPPLQVQVPATCSGRAHAHCSVDLVTHGVGFIAVADGRQGTLGSAAWSICVDRGLCCPRCRARSSARAAPSSLGRLVQASRRPSQT